MLVDMMCHYVTVGMADRIWLSNIIKVENNKHIFTEIYNVATLSAVEFAAGIYVK